MHETVLECSSDQLITDSSHVVVIQDERCVLGYCQYCFAAFGVGIFLPKSIGFTCGKLYHSSKNLLIWRSTDHAHWLSNKARWSIYFTAPFLTISLRRQISCKHWKLYHFHKESHSTTEHFSYFTVQIRIRYMCWVQLSTKFRSICFVYAIHSVKHNTKECSVIIFSKLSWKFLSRCVS
jgi:hypothetical protein